MLLRTAAATIVATAVLAGGQAQAQTSVGDCGWLVRNDPVVLNVLYPDQDAVYYIAALPKPAPGLHYRVRGDFPHSRYSSFTVYNGLPIDSLADFEIAADPGSTNPFLPGADRNASDRSYTIAIKDAKAPAAGREPNTLYTGEGQLGSPTPVVYLFYRIYVPDLGTGPSAGVPLPTIELAGGGAGGIGVATPCEEVRDALPGETLEELQRAAAEAPVSVQAPASHPDSVQPPNWTVESGLTSRTLGRVGQGDLVTGGPGSNPHNKYIAAAISRKHGDLLAIRAKAPTTPPTRSGEPVMGEGDLRYWSICSNSRSTRYFRCLSDSDVAIDSSGWFTIAISTPEARPETAANWLPFGPEPEGIVLYRHMLPSEAFFPHSAQGADESELPLAETMGDYFPRAVYCTAEQFDANGCGL